MSDEKLYGAKAAERIFELVVIGEDMERRADGIFARQTFLDAAAALPDLRWNPQCALQDLDPQEALLLPIPFSATDLAAFLLCPIVQGGGRGCQELRECLTDVQDVVVLRAVNGADMELKRAQQVVGEFDSAPEDKANRWADAYNERRDLDRGLLAISNVATNGFADDEYRERIGRVNAHVERLKKGLQAARRQADEHKIDWLNRMARAIYRRPDLSAESDAPNPHSPITAVVPSSDRVDRGISRKRLVELHKDRWSTIESDLSHAATNGLSAAKAGARNWHEDQAVTWARERGKYKESCTLVGLPTRKHRISH
ncbi:hypothetical protein QTH91_04575 [Variovorax dokdonensis]|uniref:Uncharacterized protein n=1 Tax=Variovorax dokdonensis TaxID=344883 RepID=A0ABT7N733_9BURK|nr:hypothetical protein [Variovorax dokdonensis]MDM0043749.1 hypothetical protein [Variovorax dokdonensis]